MLLDDATRAYVRGCVLATLRTWANRERPVESSSDPAYMSEELVQAHLARFYALSIQPGELRGLLQYLGDLDLVKYKTVPAGRKTILSWRILAGGEQILMGYKTDPGIQVA